jgi:hypothetical protein
MNIWQFFLRNHIEVLELTLQHLLLVGASIGLAVLAMTVPNADHAIIAAEKLTGYLLNVSHKRGGPKARLLLGFGYRSDNPQALESALRAQHLSLDVTRTHENAYGVVY